MNGRRLLLALALWAAPPVAAAETLDFSVEQTGRAEYRVRGSLELTASTAAAWAVLTDYEHIPSFVPSIRESRVLRRNGDQVLVDQRAAARMLWFSKEVEVRLSIDEQPGRRLDFKDISRKDFDSYVGFWEIASTSGTVRVLYGLDAKRKFYAPDFLARKFFRREAESLMAAIRAEILRRAGIPSP